MAKSIAVINTVRIQFLIRGMPGLLMDLHGKNFIFILYCLNKIESLTT